MTRTMNSQALVLLDRILGLSGSSSGEQYTTLDDGNVQQVIEISDIARRSLTPANTTGLFIATLQNRHEAATGLNRNPVDPYNLADTVTMAYRTNTWPVPVPRGFDIWLIDASVYTEGNATRLDWAELDLFTPTTHTAWAVRRDDMGTQEQIANDTAHLGIARWDTALPDSMTGVASVQRWATVNDEIRVSINRRLRRGTQINFKTFTNALYIDVNVDLTLGLFPEGLGQDVAT